MMTAKAIQNFLAVLAFVIAAGSIAGCVMLTPTPEHGTVPLPTAEHGTVPLPTPEPTEVFEDEPVTVTPIPDVCDISYPTLCIPVGASDVLNCTDITERRFPVVGDDSQNFDANGNGIGCESR